jgi:hypothetical protein
VNGTLDKECGDGKVKNVRRKQSDENDVKNELFPRKMTPVFVFVASGKLSEDRDPGKRK